ncbi:hypothetical protein O7627_24585 [Solwaraspora sp. WMMD1047]|uniref:hypothetical protein n=1 Tax=Solwaraspora sp. WMMD1047 TaxID=3016102 RepID=UPI002417AD38|nr:hypothetical protein [Solwaraspora sp. WMMD1047]MDG4832461.1 hypothetical protein [Solwaraspora sp. WMMD1047]
MVRRMSLRLVIVTLLGAIGVWFGSPGTAQAAPKEPKGPTTVTITGDDIGAPINVQAADAPELFAALLDQVSYLTGAGQTTAPKKADLGPKYTVVLLTDDVAKQTYDLYPLANGGPRAHRPAKQPERKSTAAWFFGRLSMSETLRAAGAPLPERSDPISGGIGGGERVIPDEGLGAGDNLDRVLGELRHLLLLNGAVLLTITLGLAGIALLVRRRTR